MIFGASSLDQIQDNISIIKIIKDNDKSMLKEVESILKNKPK